MKFEGGAIHDDGVAGIVAAVKPDDIVGIAGKEVSNLSFAFVAPLSADNCSDFRRVGRHEMPWFGLVRWRQMSQKIKKMRAGNYGDKNGNKTSIQYLFYGGPLSFWPNPKLVSQAENNPPK